MVCYLFYVRISFLICVHTYILNIKDFLVGNNTSGIQSKYYKTTANLNWFQYILHHFWITINALPIVRQLQLWKIACLKIGIQREKKIVWCFLNRSRSQNVGRCVGVSQSRLRSLRSKVQIQTFALASNFSQK